MFLKTVFGLILSTLLFSCKAEPPIPKGVQIVRVGSTVEIYSNGILKGEYTKRNTDSASLETLYNVIDVINE